MLSDKMALNAKNFRSNKLVLLNGVLEKDEENLRFDLDGNEDAAITGT